MLEVINKLIPLLLLVESSGDLHAPPGDGGKSWGCMQIQACVVDDVNRVYSLTYKHRDVKDPHKAVEICRLYLLHYGGVYRSQTGRAPTMEVFARIYNGGPDGWRERATLKYWKKVKRALTEEMAARRREQPTPSAA